MTNRLYGINAISYIFHPNVKLRGTEAFCRVPLKRVVGPSIDASIKYGQNLFKHVI
jgi:hypothetical protein